jgi:hypothetical protein
MGSNEMYCKRAADGEPSEVMAQETTNALKFTKQEKNFVSGNIDEIARRPRRTIAGAQVG